jgi:Ca-activated chloride channel homolog
MGKRATTGLVSVGLAAGLTCVGLAQFRSPTQKPQTFRSGVNTVAVYATVKDAAGRFVPDLDREAFEILDDGRPTEIVLFSNDPQPLSVAIMLHMSQGASWGEVDLRRAIVSFVDSLQPADRVSLGSFGLEIAVGANLTNDRGEIARVFAEEMWKGGGSPLWAAIRAASGSLAKEPGRRVVLINTAGRDSGGLPGFAGGRSGAERQALTDECMVYAVLFENNRDHEIESDLVALTEAVGGGHLVVPRGSDAATTMAKLAEELRHQYLLGFVPGTLDGKVHRLEVRLKNGRLRAAARRSYLARTAS